MLHTIQTKKSTEQAGKDLQDAVVRHKFGVLAVHDLQASMAKHGLKFDRPCLIYEVCQPQRAKEVLEKNTSIATALPCRIAIYREGSQTTLAMIKPTQLLGLFQEPELEPIAREVENELISIMKEASASKIG